jgi:hypothetical protein
VTGVRSLLAKVKLAKATEIETCGIYHLHKVYLTIDLYSG